MNFEFIWKGIFPTVCVMCGTVVEDTSTHICDDCYRALPLRKGFFMCCPTKSDALLYCSGVFCPLYYSGPVPTIVGELKFAGHREAAKAPAQLLAQMLRRCGMTLPGRNVCLVPIPLHRDRLRRRGYNQAQVIATEVAARTGIPLDKGLLLRANNTGPQHLRDRLQRLAMDAGFVASPRARGKVIILVDDVITTGTTMEAAALALRQQGATGVYYAAAAGNLPLLPE